MRIVDIYGAIIIHKIVCPVLPSLANALVYRVLLFFELIVKSEQCLPNIVFEISNAGKDDISAAVQACFRTHNVAYT